MWELSLIHICPFTLGIEVVHGTQRGIFSPIIERNQKVPTSREELYHAAHPDQKSVTLSIYQGESRYTQENTKIGELSIPIKHRPATEEQLAVRFTYDLSGLLEVEVQIGSTKEVLRSLIQREAEKMSQSEIQGRLEKLKTIKIHPRDQAQNQLILARASRMFEESLGEMRAHISQAISFFETTLQSQDSDRIAAVAHDMKLLLDELEKGRPL